MKLKKAGALGLSCVIALGSMAGCGSSKEKEKTDGKELPALIQKSREAGMEIETVIGDKAYSSKENIDAAIKVGMKGFVYHQNIQELEKYIENIL